MAEKSDLLWGKVSLYVCEVAPEIKAWGVFFFQTNSSPSLSITEFKFSFMSFLAVCLEQEDPLRLTCHHVGRDKEGLTLPWGTWSSVVCRWLVGEEPVRFEGWVPNWPQHQGRQKRRDSFLSPKWSSQNSTPGGARCHLEPSLWLQGLHVGLPGMWFQERGCTGSAPRSVRALHPAPGAGEGAECTPVPVHPQRKKGCSPLSFLLHCWNLLQKPPVSTDSVNAFEGSCLRQAKFTFHKVSRENEVLQQSLQTDRGHRAMTVQAQRAESPTCQIFLSRTNFSWNTFSFFFLKKVENNTAYWSEDTGLSHSRESRRHLTTGSFTNTQQVCRIFTIKEREPKQHWIRLWPRERSKRLFSGRCDSYSVISSCAALFAMFSGT